MCSTKINLLHLLKIFFAELIYSIGMFYGYAIFSMLLFGEGANSFMYSKANEIIYLALIIAPPMIFNAFKFVLLRAKHYDSKSKNYMITGVIMIIIYTIFLFRIPTSF